MAIPVVHSSLPISSTSSLSSASFECNQHPFAIGARSWLISEKTTQQILSVIQPTIDSESRRKEIIEYLQGLLEDTFEIKVYPFGSVPFKTYLPHGDVDLTAIGYFGTSQDLVAAICDLLEDEEKNNVDITVKDVLCVPAQVKVVKCNVRNISVDISVNQTAGLCALYFLEQVDQFIGKDHLFKLSVILIKAWCYYESRLLGGVHGLISTYALETMILHVMNLFHSLLHCPLGVLYKFLDYYSTFDWDSYCVGINGPVLISSLPEIEVASVPNCDKLLLTEEFLKRSREALMPKTGVFASRPAFSVKFLNILDPLKDDNNLGRSVSKSSFRRIKTALSYGARKLRQIMMFPPETIGAGLEKMFINTLERNGKGKRIDVFVPVPPYGSAATNYNNEILAGNGINYGLRFDDYDMMSHVPSAISSTFPVWNNGRGDVGPNAFFQYDYNGYFDTEECAPSLLGSPRGLRPKITTSSGDDPRTFQQNNEAFYQEKWVSKTTPSFFDCYYEGPPRNNAAALTEENMKRRGTCVFIPHLAHFMHANPTFEEYGVVPEYRKSVEEEEFEFYGRVERSCLPKYSMEDFPLLPGCKTIAVKSSAWEAQFLDGTEFRTFKPPSPTLSESGKHANSDGLISLDDDKGSPKSEEKMEVTVQLTDECEFPPLSCPAKPVMALCKKEFPPLGSYPKSKKK